MSARPAERTEKQMKFDCQILVGLLICSGIIILFVMLKSKRFFRSLLLSAAQGICALFAVNLLSAVTGVSVAVNPITAGICALGGTPAVILLLLSKLML